MCFVKIGDTYFNTMRIDYIKPDVYKIDDQYVPNVEVWIDGREHTIELADLGLDFPECKGKWEALGVADAMVETVVAKVNEALKLYGKE